MAHFHTAEGFPSAQKRPDECVFSFQGTREVFCLTLHNSNEKAHFSHPFSKKFFLAAFGQHKKLPFYFLRSKTGAKEKPHRELISVG